MGATAWQAGSGTRTSRWFASGPSIADVISEHVTLKIGRRRQPQGPVPVPRREDPVVQRRARPQRVYFCHGCGARRRRHHLPDGRRPPVASSSRSSGWPPGPASSCATSRPARPRSASSRARGSAWSPRTPRPPSSTPTQLVHARRPAGPRVPGPARLRPGRGRAVRLRVRPRRLGPPHQAPAPEGLHRPGAGHRGPGPGGPLRHLIDRFRRRLLWPIRDAVRRRDRVRRPQALRGRRRPEVPQHPRDPDLQEVARALRHRPRQAGDRQAGPGGHRRGLHRRDGLPPGRRDRPRWPPAAPRSAPTTSACCGGC